MDAYVYVETMPGTARKVAEEIAELDVRQVVVITGKWDVLVAVDDVDPASLGTAILDRIQRVRGVVRTNTQLVVDASDLLNMAPHIRPVHSLEQGVIALVHIQIDAGTAEAVIEALEQASGVEGWDLLAGDWDILVEVETETWNEAARVVLEQIQTIQGVARTSTVIAVSPKLKAYEAGTGA